MAYTTHNSIKDRPGAVAAVIGIHALIGYALVTGLATSVIETVTKPNPEASDVPIEIPLPPPPPKPDEIVEPDVRTAPPIPAPKPPIDFTRESPIDVQDIPIPDVTFTDRIVPQPGPITPSSLPADPVVPKPTPSFTPTSAKPRNGGWVRDSDYRSRWAREELTGIASFKLGIGANGRVTDCAITKSTGHQALDQATCTLIEKRARFDAAKDGNGEKTAGTFTGSIQWVLPE